MNNLIEKIKAKNKTINLAINLLRIATCPNCDGSGGVSMETVEHGCCGDILDNGECCGNSIPVQGVERLPCQWCYERDQLCGDSK